MYSTICKNTTRSNTLLTTGKIATGRYDLGLKLSFAPGLKSGMTFECFQRLGNTELLIDKFTMCVIAGVISSLINLSTFVSMLSNPADLEFED